MADFIFTMDVNAQYDSVTAARQQMLLLNHEIRRATTGDNALDINSASVQEAKMYVQALDRAIRNVSENGGNLSDEVAKEFREIRREAGLAETQTEQLRREIERLNAAGSSGSNGIRRVSNAAKVATQEVKKTTTSLEKLQSNLREGIGQTLAFGSITAVTGAIGSAVQQTLQLDKVMTDISIVSGKAASEMESYRDYAFDAAKSLGTTATEYMGASLIYEQQGGEAAQYAEQLAEATVIASNVTGRATEEMSEYITATINGFELFAKYGSQAGTKVVDVYSRLGAVSGSGLDEMAEALQRTATVAKNAGYEFEQISSAVATVSEVTRRSPEVIGSAFKSILLSFQQLREGSKESLNEFTNKVEEAFALAGVKGISIFDNGKLRDAKDIMDDIGSKWESISKEGKAAISEAVAGKEQAETFQAFMDNQERYQELLGEAYDSAGTAANQQIVYMDSLEAHVNGLKNAWQRASSAIVDTDVFKNILGQAERFLTIIGDQENAILALGTAMAPLAGIFGQLFGGKMIADWRRNIENTNLAENTKKRLDDEGKLTDELKEQLSIAEEQQQVMKNLGERASEAYKKNREEIEALNAELEESKKIRDNASLNSREILDQLGPGSTGGVEGINSAKVAAAGEAAVQEARENIEYLTQVAQENQLVIERLSSRASDIYSDIVDADDINDIQTLRTQMSLLADELNSYEGDNTEVHRVQEALRQSVEDTTLSYRELEQQLFETSTQLDRINQTEIEATDTDSIRQTIENRRRENAELAEIQRQLGETTRSPQEIQSEIDLAEAQNAEMERGARRTETYRKAVEGLSGAFGAAMPIISAFKSAQEGTITQGELVQQGLQSIGTTLLASGVPYAMAAGAVLSLVGTFGDFRTELEKTKQANEDIIRSFMSLNETVSGELSGLGSMKDSYKIFQGLDAQSILNGDAIEGDIEKSKKLKDEYVKMAQVIAQTNPELVKYYDLEGNAVVDLSAKYEDLLKDKASDLSDNYKLLLNNQKGFIEQYSAEYSKASTVAAEGNAKIAKAQETLTTAKKDGDNDKVKEALADIQKYGTEVSKAQEEMAGLSGSINTNIVQPIINSNSELQELSATTPKAAGAIKSAISDMIPEETIESFIKSGNISGVEKILNNVQSISEELTKMGQSNPKDIEKITKEFKKLDAVAKAFLLNKDDLNLNDVKDFTGKNSTDALLSNRKFSRSSEAELEEVGQMGEKLSATKDYKNESLNPFDTNSNLKYMERMEEADKKLFEAKIQRIAEEKRARGELASETEIREKLLSDQILNQNQEQEKSYDEQKDAIYEKIEAINKEDKEYQNLADSMIEVGKNADGYDTLVKRNDEITEGVGNLRKALGKLDFKDVEKDFSNAFDSDEMKEFEKRFPEIAKEMRKTAEAGGDVGAAIRAQEDELLQYQTAIREGMVANNEAYFTDWKINNADLVDFAKENYGIDANNFKTMEEFKTAISNLSASEFVNTEAYKLLVKRNMDEQAVESDKAKNQSFIDYMGQTVNSSLSGFNYLSSQSLTVADKIQVGFLAIVDAVWGLVVSLAASVNKLIAEAVKAILNGLFGPVIKAYNALAKKAKWKTIDMDAVNGKIDEIEANHRPEGTTFAKDFAEKRIKQNEQAKEYVVNNIDNLDQKAYEKNIKTIERPKGNGPGTIKNSYNDAAKTLEGGKKPGDTKTSGKGKDDDKNKKDKTKKDVENLDLELNRYYKLDNQMKVLEDHLDNISRKKDEAYGSKKINLMEAEQRSYAQQTKVLQNYVKALAQERAEKQRQLANRGFNFGADGEITNLNTRLKALQKAANAKSGEAKEKAIADVEALQDAASRYTEIQYDLIPDKKKALEEAKSAIREIEREKIEYKVELKIQKVELLQQVRDTIKEINGEDFTKLDENMVATSQQLKSNIDLYSYYQKKIAEVSRNTKLSDSDRQELINEYKKEMLSAVSEAKSAYEELGEIQSKFVSQSGEMIDKVMDQFDNIQEKASNLADVYQNVYGVRSYEDVGKMRQVQLQAIDEQVKYANKLKLEMELYKSTLKEGTEAWKEADEIVKGLGDTIQNQLIARVELLKSSFEEFKNNLLEYGDRSVFGSLGVDDFEEQMDRVLNKNDKFFNSFEKITKIGGLIAEVNRAISDSSDPQTAAAYQKFKEKELQTLMDSDKVSADQLERTKLLWDIEQKRQALEDRKNAKRTAQLIRDENGNMSYEYVRQESESDSSAKKDLADAQNALKEFDESKVKDSAAQILDVVKQTKEKINAIYEDTSLSEAERKALLERTMAQAKEDISELQKDIILWSGNSMKDGISELENAFINNKTSLEGIGLDDSSASLLFESLRNGSLQTEDILTNNVSKFSEVLGISSEEAAKAISGILQAIGNESTELTNQMLELSNKWLETTQSNLGTLNTEYQSTQNAIKQTTEALKKATGDLNSEIKNTGSAAKKTQSQIKAQRQEMERARALTNRTSTAYTNLTRQLVGKSGSGGTLGAMVKLKNEMNRRLSPAMVGTTKKADALRKKSNDTGKALSSMGGKANYAYRQHKLFDSKTITTANNNVKTFGSRSQTSANQIDNMGKKADSSRKKIASLSVALAALPGLDSGKRHYYTKINKDGSTESVSYKEKQKTSSKLQYVGYFADGGYTGEWGGSSGNQVGRPAIVHEKEWILNQNDTKNFLEGMKIQRSILTKAGGNMESVISRMAQTAGGASTGNRVDQKVEINANFPDVRDSKQIQDALSNLSLRAQSHAFNKQNRKF